MSRYTYIGIIVLLVVIIAFIVMVTAGVNLGDAFAALTNEDQPVQVSLHAKQGPQGAYTEAVYSCSKQTLNGSGVLIYAAPDRIPDGLYTYDIAAKDFGGNALPETTDPDVTQERLGSGSIAGWYFRAAPACNRAARNGTRDSLWIATFTVDPAQTPVSTQVSFSPPFRAGARGPQGPQGLYVVYAYREAASSSVTFDSDDLPTEWDIDLATGTVTNLDLDWQGTPGSGWTNAWTTFTGVNPALWIGHTSLDETDTIDGATGLQTRLWTNPLKWSGTPGAQGTGTGAGDITGVTAGTGLDGGGTSGTVTLNITHPFSDVQEEKLAGIEDEATQVIANPHTTISGSAADLNQLEISGHTFNLPDGPQGPQGRYIIQVYGEAPSASPPEAPIGGLVNVTTGQVTPPTDTAGEILGSAWAEATFTLSDAALNKLWIAQATINPAIQSGQIVPAWGTPFTGGAHGPQGPAGETGLSLQPAFTESAAAPSKPTTISYLSGLDFNFAPSNTWSTDAPVSPTDPVWMILIPYQVGNYTSSIDTADVTTPVQLTGSSSRTREVIYESANTLDPANHAWVSIDLDAGDELATREGDVVVRLQLFDGSALALEFSPMRFVADNFRSMTEVDITSSTYTANNAPATNFIPMVTTGRITALNASPAFTVIWLAKSSSDGDMAIRSHEWETLKGGSDSTNTFKVIVELYGYK